MQGRTRSRPRQFARDWLLFSLSESWDRRHSVPLLSVPKSARLLVATSVCSLQEHHSERANQRRMQGLCQQHRQQRPLESAWHDSNSTIRQLKSIKIDRDRLEIFLELSVSQFLIFLGLAVKSYRVIYYHLRKKPSISELWSDQIFINFLLWWFYYFIKPLLLLDFRLNKVF